VVGSGPQVRAEIDASGSDEMIGGKNNSATAILGRIPRLSTSYVTLEQLLMIGHCTQLCESAYTCRVALNIVYKLYFRSVVAAIYYEFCIRYKIFHGYHRGSGNENERLVCHEMAEKTIKSIKKIFDMIKWERKNENDDKSYRKIN